MTMPLINPIEIEIRVKVSVSHIRTHFSTAIENPSEWFHWSNVVYDKDSNPMFATLAYWPNGNEKRLAKRVFTDRDFAAGLQAFLRVKGPNTMEVQYQGEGEFDIDALGADWIVQYAVYDEILMS